MERRCFCVFTVLLLKVVLGVCDESSEETPKEVLGEEYAQIFYSLPTLFEYLLEILHERPEILEKDDITFFQDVPQETCEGDEKTKREVDVQCGIQANSLEGKDNLVVFKRHVVSTDISKEIHTNYVNDDTMGEIITTVAKTKSSGIGLTDNVAKNLSKPKTEKTKRESNNKRKSEINTKTKDTVKVRENVNFDDSFLGSIDWTKFYLTPDEVEEQAVKTERAIEEHNKKKGKCTYWVCPVRIDKISELGQDSAKVEGIPTDAVPSQSERDRSHCIVGGAHAFILRISSFFGLAPLKFESKSNGFTVTISNAMCVYSYILVTILVICTIFGLVAEINVGVERSVRMSSRMSQVVSTCDVLVVAATAGAGVYGAPRRMRNMLKFMDHVAAVDNSIGGQYSIMTERKLCALLLAILIFFSVLLADDFCFYAMQAQKLERQWDVVTNYIGFYLLWYVVVILELQFAFTALSVRARFQAVNDALALTARNVTVPIEKPKNPSPLNIYAIRMAPVDSQRAANVSLLVDTMTSQAGDQPVVIRKTVRGTARLAVSPCEAVRRLAALHGSLCEVVRRIDSSYGLPIAVVLISTLLHLIVTPYFLIMEIIVSTNRVHFLVLQFLWCLTHMLRMLVVVEPCHYTIAEGKRTESLICRLMNSAPSTGVLPSRLELFSRQLLLQSVSYTPMGMCTLDRPLVASVIGAVTTYLVILIQFQRYDT